VKAQAVVYDRVVCVVRFEEVLQRPWSLLRCRLYVVNFDGGEVDGRVNRRRRAEERR
jgi:hypothetical protein